MRAPADQEAIADFCDRHGLELAGSVPWSEEVVTADRERVPAVDWPPAGAFVDAVAAFASRFEVTTQAS